MAKFKFGDKVTYVSRDGNIFPIGKHKAVIISEVFTKFILVGFSSGGSLISSEADLKKGWRKA